LFKKESARGERRKIFLVTAAERRGGEGNTFGKKKDAPLRIERHARTTGEGKQNSAVAFTLKKGAQSMRLALGAAQGRGKTRGIEVNIMYGGEGGKASKIRPHRLGKKVACNVLRGLGSADHNGVGREGVIEKCA